MLKVKKLEVVVLGVVCKYISQDRIKLELKSSSVFCNLCNFFYWVDYVIKLNKFGKYFSCFISLRACEFCATFYGFVVIEMKPFMSLWSWNLAFSPCKYVLIQLLVGLVPGFLIGFGDQVTTEKNWTVLQHLLCTVDMFVLRRGQFHDFFFPKWNSMGPVGSQNRCSTENSPFK